jgi:hypothetical protein
MIAGSVIVVTLRSEQVSKIDLTLQGVIAVRNNLVKGKNVRHVLFEDTLTLWDSRESDEWRRASQQTTNDSSATNTNEMAALPRGEHNFAFELDLPKKGLYNSLEFERGSISYILRASYHRVGDSSPVLTSEKALSVICPLDVGTLPPPKPARLEVEVRKKKRQRGSIGVSLHMPRKGYLKGEMIPVKITVQHLKPIKSMTGVIVTLSRIYRVCGEGLEAQSFRKDLSQTISPLYTDPSTFSCTVSTNIRVPPDTFPTINGHHLISFQYCVEAVLDLAGKWNLQVSDLADHGALHNGFVDTDKLKEAKGVVSLWSEVVIGTMRSIDSATTAVTLSSSLDGTSVNRPSSVTYEPSTRSAGSTSDYVVLPVVGSSNTSHTPLSVTQLSRTSPQSTESSVSNYQIRYEEAGSSSIVTQTMTAENEKARMRQFEDALLPSAPPVPMDAAPVYTPELTPGPPPLPQHLEVDVPPGIPVPSYAHDESSVTASAPEYPVDGATYPVSDKLEAERARLQQLASMPLEGTGNGVVNASAPPFQQGTPSFTPQPACSLGSRTPTPPRRTSSLNHDDDDDDDDLYSSSVPPPSSSTTTSVVPSSPAPPRHASNNCTTP